MFYKTLFNINIRHGYFLDKDNKKFSRITKSDEVLTAIEKEEALASYTITDYLNIIPTPETQALLKNHRMILRPHHQGFRVLITTLEETVGNQKKYRPLIQLENDTALIFEIKASDPYFYNYTNINDLTSNRLYLFSNQVPDDQAGNFKNIFQNRGGLINSRFLLNKEGSLNLMRALIEDQSIENEINHSLSLAHLIEDIEKNEQLTLEEKRDQIDDLLINTIARKKKNNTIGYLRLVVKGDGIRHLFKFNESDPNDIKQYTLEPALEFTLSFLNRRTFWRYISTIDETTLVTNNKKWSAKNGFIDIQAQDFNASGLDPADTNPEDYAFPNPTFEIVKKEGNNYYSEIFI